MTAVIPGPYGAAMAAISTAAPSTTTRPRRLPDPARRRLLIGVVLVAVGSFLPWLHTPVGNVLGSSGAGLWTFYAAMVGFGGVLLPVRMRKAAGVQAALLGLVAPGIVVWFLGDFIAKVGVAGWMPGPGVVLVFGGGVLAVTSGWAMLTSPAPERRR